MTDESYGEAHLADHSGVDNNGIPYEVGDQVIQFPDGKVLCVPIKPRYHAPQTTGSRGFHYGWIGHGITLSIQVWAADRKRADESFARYKTRLEGIDPDELMVQCLDWYGAEQMTGQKIRFGDPAYDEQDNYSSRDETNNVVVRVTGIQT